MKVLKAFFKRKETYLGIAVALLFQIIFFSVWLTAYDGIDERLDQFNVAVFNNDEQACGQSIAETLEKEAPFQVEEVNHFKEALNDMDHRKWDMVIDIPASFSEDILNGQPADINYYINQSTPSLTKQIMETAATTVTQTINDEVYVAMQSNLADELPEAIAAESPQPEIAAQIADVIMEEIQKMSQNNVVEASIIKTNDVDGFKATMIPLMVVLASFIGAMIMGQQLQFASDALKGSFNKWALFLIRQIINMGLAFSISIITLIIMRIFSVTIETDLLLAWIFQSILFFSFLCISQIFVILFGNAGMVFNIALTAIQLVSSGALVPRTLLSSFFQKIGSILPATHGVNGYFSSIYGGGDLPSDINHLLIISGISLLIAVLGISFTHVFQKTRGI